jgi:protein ImuB
MSLYACIYAREFPAQALLRLRPDLRPHPCVVLEGDPPLQSVCARNTPARRLGLEPGMTRVEVDTFPGIVILRRSHSQEASARAALLDCAALFSPAAEDLSSPTAFIAVLDITGTTRLHGPPDTLAQSLHHRVRAAGISASVAIAQNFHAAICLARGLRTVRHPHVVPPGKEAAALAPLPISVLDLEPALTPDHAETFAAWGIHTLADLAALPETALIARMGQLGRSLRQFALGTHPHHFTPIETAPSYTEILEFDAPVEQLESLLFVVSTMLDQLILRVSSRALAIATVTVTLYVEPRGEHVRTVRPALPINDKHLWLKLIHLDVDAHPPGAPVLALTLTAEPGRTSKIQMGLFSPQLPDATRLDVALARVRAVVGEDRLGTPMLTDTHRTDAFQLQPFSVTDTSPKSRVRSTGVEKHRNDLSSRPAPGQRQRVEGGVGNPTNDLSFRPEPRSGVVEKPASALATGAQRQIRPPEQLFVTTSNHQPVSFYFRQRKYTITRAYGPWLSAGDWWNPTLWGTQEWDIVAQSPEGALLCCCITRDLMQNTWHMVALYD